MRAHARGRYSHPSASSLQASSWLSMLLVLVGVSVFVLLSSGVARLIQSVPSPSFEAPHQIPQLVGMSLSVAQQRAQSDGLSVEVMGERPSERYPRGAVIQQSPVAGWGTSDERTLRVTISSGLMVPNMLGQTLAEAQAKSIQLGWTLILGGEATADTRIKLQYPEPGLPASSPGEISVAFSD